MVVLLSSLARLGRRGRAVIDREYTEAAKPSRSSRQATTARSASARSGAPNGSRFAILSSHAANLLRSSSFSSSSAKVNLPAARSFSSSA